jgi:hypothetical protein
MPYASLAVETTIGLPQFDPRLLDEARAAAKNGARALAFAAQSIAAAAFCWLVLAAPAFLDGL